MVPSSPVAHDKLERKLPDSVTRGGLLRESVFSDWRDGTALEDTEELQKNDPLATQIWKLYSRTKTQLPNQERMENLTWRMMAVSLRKEKEREQAQARFVLFSLCFMWLISVKRDDYAGDDGMLTGWLRQTGTAE